MSNALTGVRFGVFYQSLPMIVAERHGHYRDQDLEVEHHKVTSSTQQFEWLGDGRYDFIQTSPDNVANYRYNQGNPLNTVIDSRAFLGLEYGMNAMVCARPGIDRIEDLAGKRLAVDAPRSGFAFVLYKILRLHGLELGVDYEVDPIGGVAERYEALVRGECDGTLLSGGFEIRAAAQGCTQLRTLDDVFRPYVGVVAAARKEWLDEHHDVAVRFSRAYLAATRWVIDSANRKEAEAMLADATGASAEVAHLLVKMQTTPLIGVVTDGTVDREGLRNVLRLRSEFGGFETDPDPDSLLSEQHAFVRSEVLAEAQSA
jgi:ABC-type nitrate/sulfonate/bicarbonate transport system substrate-binding protein